MTLASLVRYRDWPIRARILVLLLAASAVPIAAGGAMAFRESRDRIESDAVALLESRADHLAGELDGFHREFQNSARRLARHPAIVDFCRAGEAARPEEAALVETLLGVYDKSDPRYRGLGVFDVNAKLRAATEPGMRGRTFGFRPHFKDAVRGALSISDLYVSVPESGSTPSIAYSAPVIDEGRVVGVVTLWVRASAFWEVVRGANGRAGEGSYAILLDRRGIRIAHSFREDFVFRPTAALDPATVEELVAERRFGERTRELLEMPIANAALAQHARPDAPERASFRDRSPATARRNVYVARKLERSPWTLVCAIPEDAIVAPVRGLVARTLLTCGAIILVALLAGLALTRGLIRPVRALSRAAEAVGRGELATRVGLHSKDELGTLAAAFDRMAGDLERARQDLEAKVEERTEALAAANRALGERNRGLADKTAELTRRQLRDAACARALGALAGDGPLDEVVRGALREIAAPAEAVVLACYRVDAEAPPEKRLDPIAGYGLSEGAPADQAGGEDPGLPPAAPAGGLVAEAFAARRPIVVDGIPEGLALRFEAAIAGGAPRAVALVPLAVADRPVGLLAVGALAAPGAESLAVLAEFAFPLGLTIARHELRLRTARYSEQLSRANQELRAQKEELLAQKEELLAQRAALEQKGRDLEEKTREAGRANELKSEFLANMSHELRTPLNAVIGFSDLLLEEARGALTVKQGRYVEDILASGRHLLGLINEILDLAKIEAGRTKLDIEAVETEGAVREAAALVEGAARKKQVAVRTTVRTGRRVRADRAKLRQVVLNLLSNAIKFGPERSAVEVGAEDAGAFVRFFVRDEGPGIDASLRPELFQPFVRGEGALVKRHQGTGLGLAISKRLVEQHGGSIEVQPGTGKGTTFAFTIPAEPAPANAQAPVPVPAPAPAPAPADGERDAAGPGIAGAAAAAGAAGPAPSGSPAAAANGNRPAATLPPTEVPAGAPRPGAGQPGPAPVVIIAEDEAATRRLMRAWLEPAGYAVAEAATAREALDLTARLRPAAIVLDLGLGRDDGLRLLDELKRGDRTREVPVVVTSVGDGDAHGLAVRAADYMPKPVDRARLLGRLREVVEPPSGGKPPLVLAIDDDPRVAALLRGALEPAGYRLLAAERGAEGLALARRERPQVAIVDLILPDLSGFEVIEALSADERTRRLPVIVLTAADVSDAERDWLKGRVLALAEKGDLTAASLAAAVDRATGRGPRAGRADGARAGDGGGAGAGSRGAPTVLVVDDHDLNRELVRSLLERRGYRVLLAADGDRALESARRDRPALVLMDLAMPGRDGFSAARELKADPRTATIPLVALTALAMRGDEERARLAGFDGYLAKPVDRRILEETVARWVG